VYFFKWCYTYCVIFFKYYTNGNKTLKKGVNTLKKDFIYLSIIGALIVLILCFFLPNNPYEIIPPTNNGDKTLWFCFVILYIACYLSILWSYYDIAEIRKSKKDFVLALKKEMKIYGVSTTKGINFERFTTYKKENIPLGKIIIDEKNKSIFVYETFCQTANKQVCKPDIRYFEIKQLTKCEIVLNDTDISKQDFLDNIKNIQELSKETYKLRLDIKNYEHTPVCLDLSSINSTKTFITIYDKLQELIKENKK